MNIDTAEPRMDRPCPPWCRQEPGHGWDGVEKATGRTSRGHGWDVNDNVTLWLEEYEDDPNSISRPPTISLWVGGNEAGREFTATDVRRIAAELLNGADELDRVTGTEDQR